MDYSTNKNLSNLLKGEKINCVDIGSIGGIRGFLEPFKEVINFYGFEPNPVECEKLNNNFGTDTVKFLPYAISNKKSLEKFYITKDPECSSLLIPDNLHLSRFDFFEKFEISKIIEVDCCPLQEIFELSNIDFDIIKVDTQGMDLDILKSAPNFIDSAFLVEVEPAFSQNYINEYTIGEMINFMKNEGFKMIQLQPHMVSRNNIFSKFDKNGEILWAETLWIKDYVEIFRKNKKFKLSKSKALKSLLICAILEMYSYGLELTKFFLEQNIIEESEYEFLQSIENWKINKQLEKKPNLVIEFILRMFPTKLRIEIERASASAIKKHSLLHLTN